jgi:EamA-like transporter family
MNPGVVDWGDGRVLAGNALLLLAAISWALGSCLYRRYSWRSPFWVQTFWQLAVSILPVGAIVLTETAGGPVRWSPELVAILAYNCIVTTALGYFLWGEGIVDDAGGNGGTSADAHPNRRFRAVNADLRRRGDSRCCAQHCINRRRNSRNPATVILTRFI